MAFLNDLIQGGQEVAQSTQVGGGIPQAMQSGLKLAQTAQDLQLQKQQQQENEQKLNQGKFDSSMARLKTYSSMAPEIRKRSRKNMEAQDATIGIPQSAIYDAIDADPTFGQQVNMMISNPKFMKSFGADPAAAINNLQQIASSGYMDEAKKQGLVNQYQDFLKEDSKQGNALAVADRRAEATENNTDTRQGRFETTTHNQVMNKVKTDKVLNNRLQQMNNLQNAQSAFEQGTATPQQFEELQQAVKSNLGIKGSGGVTERQRTYLESLGIDAAAATQFVSSKPTDIRAMGADPLIHHVMGLVKAETTNIEKQALQRVDALTAGNESLYSKRPDLKQDLNNFVGGYKSQYDSTPIAKPPPTEILQAAKLSIKNGRSVDDTVARLKAAGFNVTPKDLQGK